MINDSKIVFFGSSNFSVYVLDELKIHNILPYLIITTPDKPKGRKMALAPTPVKIWAEQNNIECLDPASLNPSTGGQEIILKLSALSSQLFLVASYGKIIPKEIFEIPKHKTLNIHPSLLPKYRGASPIQSQILNDEKEIGITIMQIDEKMDHGPIVAQKSSPPSDLTNSIDVAVAPLSLARRGGMGGEDIPSKKNLEKYLAIQGARLFAHILPEWLMGAIDPIIQDESKATYCKKIEKSDGQIQMDLKNMLTGPKAKEALLKIKAFEEWPTAYFFLDTPKQSESGSTQRKRIIITDATIENDMLKILKLKPEGKNEMTFEDFMRGLRTQNSS